LHRKGRGDGDRALQGGLAEEGATMRRYGIAWLMLVTLVGAVLLPPFRAGALVPSIPAFGHPFSSRTADGGRFLGSFDFDQFVQDEAGNLVVRGVVLSTTATVPGEQVTVPVRILVATCDLLHLELGPITQLGLLDPFHLVLQEDTDELDRGEHCAIATAAASGDTARLVSLLNQEARFGPGGTERHSCPATQWAECSNAITTCGDPCQGPYLGPQIQACATCLNALGAESCIVCVLF